MQQTTEENEIVVSNTSMESVTPENVETTEAEQAQSTKLKAAQDVIAYLAELFPLCFSIKGEAKPLKIGIFQDLASRLDEDEKLSRTVLRAALRKYTSSWRYLASIKEGAKRVDLDGQDAGAIEAEHAEHAATSLAESKQKVAEKRKQQRKQNAAVNKTANQNRKPKPKAAGADKQSRPSSSAVSKPVVAKSAKKVVEKRDTSIPLTAGMQVNLLMGNSPVSCTLKEVNGNDVVVETASGMTIKTEVKQII